MRDRQAAVRGDARLSEIARFWRISPSPTTLRAISQEYTVMNLVRVIAVPLLDIQNNSSIVGTLKRLVLLH